MPIERHSERPRGRRDPSRARRGRGDRGAILAEAAFVTPIFIILIFGIIEFGGAFRDYLTLNNATTNAARQASISANSPDADYQIIQTIKKQSAALNPSEVTHIVVFHPSTPSSSPTASCMAGTASVGTGTNYTDACNVYTNTAFSWASNSTNFGCASASADQYWCPTNRKAALTGANGPPDYIGVYIQIVHPYFTGLFGKSITMSKTAIIKIEPQSLQ
jgi:Flp pilus assembly protein TadG